MIKEDIKPGYAPKEISFGGYTTKNLHHSADAVRAFQDTIERLGEKHPSDILSALKHTDDYMKLNDMHLEQGKAPDESELQAWRHAHTEARNMLNKVGEFMHHEDYWHMHEHEIQDMENNYTPATAGAEMADSYKPEGEMLPEGLTDKTIKSGDKVKVARVIADMLGVDNAETMSPDVAVNAGLRKVKNKRMTPELVGVVKKMLALAAEVGIKVDQSLVPKAVSEETITELKRDTLKSYIAKSMGSKSGADFMRGVKMASGDDKSADELRKTSEKRSTGIHTAIKKLTKEELEEASYAGNIGIVELMKFYQKANPDLINKVKQLITQKKNAEAWNIIQKQTGVKLVGAEFNEQASAASDDKTAPEEDEKDTVQNIPTQVGHTMQHPADDQLRRRKVLYKLGEWVEMQEGQDYSVTVNHYKDGEKTDHEYVVRNANDRRHAKHIAMQKHEKKIGGLKQGEKFASSNTQVRVRELQEAADLASLRKQIDKHTELAVQANKAGDDAAAKKHQEHVNKFKTQMAKLVRSEETELEEGVFGDPVIPNKKSELQTLEDLQSADYKTTVSGHKYRARHINFAASKGNAAPVEGDEDGQSQKRTHKSHGPLLKPVKEEVEDEHDGISTESDLEDMIKQIEDEEDILDAYDDDELVIVDDETGEIVSDVKEEVEQINEVLSRAERMRAKMRFARTSSKRERRMKVVLKMRSSSATINKRARRLAINLLKKRIMKKPASQLTVGEKERVERMLAKRKNLINRLSMKLAPRVRKIENERLSHSKVTK